MPDAQPFARLPLALPVDPMLCKAVPAIPQPDAVAGGLLYEPKWDGFRCLVIRDGDDVALDSRGAKPLTRYFPEVVDAVRRLLPGRVVADAELVVRTGRPGHQRLDWGALTQRIHPAASRIARLSAETPAELILFDLLAEGDADLTAEPFERRRARLLAATASLTHDDPIHVTRATEDPQLAASWFEAFEGAGLDGVVAKPKADPYAPGKRTLFKIKHARTCEAVAWGYRVHKSGQGVGSILFGLYDAEGQLRPVGGASAFSNAARLELVELLEPLVRRDADGRAETWAGERSRFTPADKNMAVVPLEPELVAELRFDQLEGDRFRHNAQFVRWRPDRTPESCLLDQIDRAPAYDLDAVLAERA